MSLSYDAMVFAREVHKNQRRKYTNQPYFDHLAEVTGIAMSVGWHDVEVHPDTFMAVCWLHDSIEDQDLNPTLISHKFSGAVADAVMMLSDLETGNRMERKRLARVRLAKSPAWVQTIKLADLISNTSSIVQFDPKFAVTYLKEKRALLDVLTKGDKNLHKIASELANQEILL